MEIFPISLLEWAKLVVGRLLKLNTCWYRGFGSFGLIFSSVCICISPVSFQAGNHLSCCTQVQTSDTSSVRKSLERTLALTSWMNNDSTQTQLSLVDDFVIDSVHSQNSNPEGKWASSVIDRAIIGAVRSHYCTSPSVIVYIDLETPAGSVFLSALSEVSTPKGSYT